MEELAAAAAWLTNGSWSFVRILTTIDSE
jgi:hypothetical protein